MPPLGALRRIGVGASEFFGVQSILPKFSQTWPKSFRANFAVRFLVWSLKNGLYLFFCKCCAPYLKSNNVGRHFCPDFQGFHRDIWGFCLDFQGFCQNFQRFCLSFQQIKTFGRALAPPAPPPPTPLLRRPFLPLSAVTVSLHYLPKCLQSRATCDKTEFEVNISELEVNNWRFVTMVLLHDKDQQ